MVLILYLNLPLHLPMSLYCFLCSYFKKLSSLSAAVKKWPQCPSTGDRINKIWYTHTMGKYSIIKRNEILTQDTHGWTLITANKVKEARHKRPHIIPFTWTVYERQICTDRRQISGCLGLGGWSGEWLQKRMKYLFGVMEMFYNWTVVAQLCKFAELYI